MSAFDVGTECRPYIHPYNVPSSLIAFGSVDRSKAMGSLRERRPGVWEIRVAAGRDVLTGRTLQRSVTFYGTATEAEVYRAELAEEYAQRRTVTRTAPMLTVAELLDRWLAADHSWKPS